MMGLSRQFFVAGILASSAAFAEDVPAMKFSETKAEDSFSLNEMDMSLLQLSHSDNGDVLRETMGIYDNVVGLACEWTQETKWREDGYYIADTKVTHHACTLGEMPKAWRDVESEDLDDILYDGRKKSVAGKVADLEVYSGLIPSDGAPHITMIIAFQRAWNKGTHEVCVQTYMKEIDNYNPSAPISLGSLAIKHGCYRVDNYDLKSAIALELGQAI